MKGFAAAVLGCDLVDPETGEQRVIRDLAWADGMQAELTEPVEVLLDAGFRFLSAVDRSQSRCMSASDGGSAEVVLAVVLHSACEQAVSKSRVMCWAMCDEANPSVT